jgi:hypothetical protein
MLVTCPPRGVRRIPTRGARGSAVQDENANRLLRQYLAKSADLRRFSLRDLDDIAERINTRPRHVLDWATAAEMLPLSARVRCKADRPLSRDGGTAGLIGQGPSVAAVVRSPR